MHPFARSLGVNAIHAAAGVLDRLAEYEARRVTIDGCDYREGLNAVRINGGIAGNVIPDECQVEVNFRFAPDRSVAAAAGHVTTWTSRSVSAVPSSTTTVRSMRPPWRCRIAAAASS